MEEDKVTPLQCTCVEDQNEIVFEDSGVMDVTNNNDLQNIPCLSNLNNTEKSDVDTDSLESVSIASSANQMNGTSEYAKISSPSIEIGEHDKAETHALKCSSISSFTDSCCSHISANSQTDQQESVVLKNGKSNEISIKETTKSGNKFTKTKTFDLGQVKSGTNSKFSKSKDDRRKSTSCIFQTCTDMHGIRETKSSRMRFEKCHEKHDSFDCEGDDYLTPTQKKDNMLRSLRKEVKDLKKMLNDKTQELETTKINFDKKLEILLAEKDTEKIILKSDMEALEKKHEDLQKSYQVSLNTINMLEDNLKEVKDSIIERDKNNERVFLETYRKGQMSALFERNEELERIAVKCDGSSITIKELLQKLLVTETELGKWQSLRRQESYDSAPKPETESDTILRFLKDSFYHYATDEKDSDFHLRAMIRILHFTDVQKKKIADAIVAKRKKSSSSI